MMCKLSAVELCTQSGDSLEPMSALLLEQHLFLVIMYEFQLPCEVDNVGESVLLTEFELWNPF